jgi:radical SAM protein with 4Fe4S-binding SPASM domain
MMMGIKKARRSLLPWLDIELTERCNNNCVHCCINRPAADRAAQRRELSASQLDDVFKQAAKLGCLTVRLTGGEPLLRADFPEIYLAARRKGLRVKLLTNGCLLTPALARLFAAVPPLEKIELTAYGHDRRSYEAATRMPGSFAQFKRGLSLLSKYQVPHAVKGVLFQNTLKDKARFESWVTRRTGEKPAITMMLDLRHRRDSRTRNSVIQCLRLSPVQAAATACADPLFREQMKVFPTRYMGAQGKRLFTCSAGTSVCLDAYGRLQPCLLLRKRELTYDLNKGSLRDALTNFFPRVLSVEAKYHGYFDRCARCGLKGFCHQCPARSYIEHGALDKPVEYLCAVAHQQAWPLHLNTRSPSRPGRRGDQVSRSI